MELPNFLKTQVREGKVVLVLGAGASQGAVQTHGAKPPNGAQLARLIADHFLGDRFPTAPLSQTSEYAISESSLVEVQEFIPQHLRKPRTCDVSSADSKVPVARPGDNELRQNHREGI